MAYKLTGYTVDSLGKITTPFANSGGTTPCVELVRQVTGAPETSAWARGKRVADCSAEDIVPGTSIATFLYEPVKKVYYYPQTSPKDGRSMHAAIYLSHDENQINVIDQWNGVDKIQKRPLRFNRKDREKGRRSNIGEEFHVVE